MNKTELIQTVAAKTGLTQKDTANTLDTILETIKSAVAAEDKVQIIGFGSFEARNRQARKGHNPGTGVEILIPASRVPAFTAGKAFKEAVAIKPAPVGKAKKKK